MKIFALAAALCMSSLMFSCHDQDPQMPKGPLDDRGVSGGRTSDKPDGGEVKDSVHMPPDSVRVKPLK